MFAFGLAGMTLMGLPPSAGFLAKWLLIDAALGQGYWFIAVVALAGGLLAAVYVFRVLRQAFLLAPERLCRGRRAARARMERLRTRRGERAARLLRTPADRIVERRIGHPVNIVYFTLGLACLVIGAELLVRGSARLALSFGISPLVAGLTVVAFGTSTPELAVSVQAALVTKPTSRWAMSWAAISSTCWSSSVSRR